MAESLQLPDDFPARVRAARGYMNGISQKDFAVKIGMSEGYVKHLERGKSIRGIEGLGLIMQMAEVSGLPQAFFLGRDAATPLETRLQAIEDELFALKIETEARDLEAEARDLEVLRRLDEAL